MASTENIKLKILKGKLRDNKRLQSVKKIYLIKNLEGEGSQDFSSLVKYVYVSSKFSQVLFSSDFSSVMPLLVCL